MNDSTFSHKVTRQALERTGYEAQEASQVVIAFLMLEGLTYIDVMTGILMPGLWRDLTTGVLN